jgi:hypothetical protein
VADGASLERMCRAIYREFESLRNHHNLYNLGFLSYYPKILFPLK